MPRIRPVYLGALRLEVDEMRFQRMIAAVIRATVKVVRDEVQTAGQFVRVIGLPLVAMRKHLWEPPTPVVVLVASPHYRSAPRRGDRYSGMAGMCGCHHGGWRLCPAGSQQLDRARFTRV